MWLSLLKYNYKDYFFFFFFSFSIFILYITNTEHIITNLQFHKIMKYDHACYFLSLFSSYTSFHYTQTYNMYKGRQYCIAKFRTVSIDGDFLSLFLLLYVQAFPIRKTSKIKQAKYRKYLNCGHLSSKQIHLYVCVNY